MNKYKNTILLRDDDTTEVNAIIYTNETARTIQDAVSTAANNYYDNDIFDSTSVYDYILEYLQLTFDLLIVEVWDKDSVVCY